MSEYGDLVLNLDSFAGQESQWGARNWKLWLEWELDLFETYKEWEIPHLLWNNYVLKQEKKPSKNGAKAVEVTSAMSFVLAYCASLEAPWFVETFPDIGNKSLDNVEVCRTTKSTEALDVHMVVSHGVLRILPAPIDAGVSLGHGEKHLRDAPHLRGAVRRVETVRQGYVLPLLPPALLYGSETLPQLFFIVLTYLNKTY